MFKIINSSNIYWARTLCHHCYECNIYVTKQNETSPSSQSFGPYGKASIRMSDFTVLLQIPLYKNLKLCWAFEDGQSFNTYC